MFSHRLWRLSRSFQVGVISAFIMIGTKRSGAVVLTMPAKPLGATPTTVIGVLLIVITWFRIDGSTGEAPLPVTHSSIPPPDARPARGRHRR